MDQIKCLFKHAKNELIASNFLEVDKLNKLINSSCSKTTLAINRKIAWNILVEKTVTLDFLQDGISIVNNQILI